MIAALVVVAVEQSGNRDTVLGCMADEAVRRSRWRADRGLDMLFSMDLA